MKYQILNQENSESKSSKIHKKKKCKRTTKNMRIKIEFTSFQKSKSKLNENENKSNNDLINTIEKYEDYYEKSIDITFKNYASRMMRNLMKRDINNIEINHIKKFSIDLNYRISLINYLFSIIEINQIESEIYFLTIEIFDSFLEKLNEKIEKKEATKLLITSFYIALKYESVDFISSDWISCFNFKTYQFSSLELEEEEVLIYEKIGFIFGNNGVIDYFNICIKDYKLNYYEYCKINATDTNQINNHKLFICIEKFFVYMLKLLPLDIEFFYTNKKFELVIVCIIYSFDLLRSYVLLNNEFLVFHEWTLTFFKSMNYDIKKIKLLYKQIDSFFSNFKLNISEIWESFKNN